jgi:ergothioneine biosynthesis protein EgtB
MRAHPNIVDSKPRLLGALARARAETDELFRIVRDDSLYERPIPERHRIVFYIGHLEAFDWNLLRERALGLKAFDPELDQLFAFGIDPVDGGLPTDQPSDWPALSEVYRYVSRVRETLDVALERASFSEPASPLLRDGYLLNVAIEHRLMHAETLAYMFHQLPLEKKVPCPGGPAAASASAEPRMVRIPAGTATLGLPRSADAFGWDNEFEAHEVEVSGFSIDAFKVTNRQFLEFISAGGYENRSLWADADWAWKEADGIRHPGFWVRRGDRWLLRTMFAEIPLPLDWPVYISHAEASAYARWAGKALPTEAQWHRAAYGTPDGTERDYPWGSDAPAARHGNFDFHRWDPAPVNMHPAGASAFGVHDLVGNGWEWTSTVFGPFPGFEPFSFYPGYSANFFDSKHYVMKGGSSRTAAALLRRSFRNWFQTHYPYVYAGFRCVRNDS